MIKENEVYSMLSDTFPDLRDDFEKAGGVGCPFKMAAIFAAFTKKIIKSQKQADIQKCLRIAEWVMKEGSDLVKNAMQYVYVFSVSQAMPSNKDLMDDFPPLLKNEFRRQVTAGSN